MVNPDFPDPATPIDREWLQWMIINIPGNNLELGQTIVPNQSPQPDKGTHRYRFYLYDQLGRRLPPNTSFGRKGFQRAVFLWQNQLMRRGLAINGFRVRSRQQLIKPLNAPQPPVSNVSATTNNIRRLVNQLDRDSDSLTENEDEDAPG